MSLSTDEIFMKETFKLALKGCGHVSPNPLVGALIIKDNIIIGSGHHEKYGGPHAEANAISSCNETAEGSTVYCNLEPCCHFDKQTPPCAQMLIKNKVKKVVISTLDPNPMVSGNGVSLLRDAGIEVIVGVLEKEGLLLNEVFFHNIKTQMPFVHIKLAQTLDGKIATHNGDSKWISNEAARLEVHKLRLKYDAVMIGRNTLSKDNAKLNIRMGVEHGAKHPYRIIIGKLSNIDLSLAIFNDEHTGKNIIVTSINDYRNTNNSLLEKHKILGTQVILQSPNSNSNNLNDIYKKLYEFGIKSILVEGGAELITNIISKNEATKISFYICPILLGSGLSYFNLEKIDVMAQALRFSKSAVRELEGQAVMDVYPAATSINMEPLCSQA